MAADRSVTTRTLASDQGSIVLLRPTGPSLGSGGGNGRDSCNRISCDATRNVSMGRSGTVIFLRQGRVDLLTHRDEEGGLVILTESLFGAGLPFNILDLDDNPQARPS
jgi:hypothetical protein